MSEMIFRRRRLPHQDLEGRPIFITACLHGSLSAQGLAKIRRQKQKLDSRPKPDQLTETEWEIQKHKLFFAFIDQLLDCHASANDLADPQQAEIVQNAFLHFANERYKLLAFVVMPSHHHWLFLPDERWSVEVVRQNKQQSKKFKTPREIISHSIQAFTARMCNRVRGKQGQYWQHESFDHWPRDDEETLRIIEYIEMNPVKAGLVKTPTDYQWSSARLRQQQSIYPGDPIPKPSK